MATAATAAASYARAARRARPKGRCPPIPPQPPLTPSSAWRSPLVWVFGVGLGMFWVVSSPFFKKKFIFLFFFIFHSADSSHSNPIYPPRINRLQQSPSATRHSHPCFPLNRRSRTSLCVSLLQINNPGKAKDRQVKGEAWGPRWRSRIRAGPPQPMWSTAEGQPRPTRLRQERRRKHARRRWENLCAQVPAER